MEAVWYSLTAAFAGFLNFLPSLMGAVVLLVFGWLVASAIAGLVRKGLEAVGMDRSLERAGVHDFIRRTGSAWTASKVIAELVKWFVFLIFIQAAAAALAMPQLTSIINSIVLFIPNIIVAVGIILLGSVLAKFLGGLVRGSVSEMGVGNANALASLTQFAVLAFAVIAAIDQLGIAKTVVATLFIGLVAAVSLAVGLAFGLGGRDVAARITEGWYSRGREVAGRVSAQSSDANVASTGYSSATGSTAATTSFAPGAARPYEQSNYGAPQAGSYYQQGRTGMQGTQSMQNAAGMSTRSNYGNEPKDAQIMRNAQQQQQQQQSGQEQTGFNPEQTNTQQSSGQQNAPWRNPTSRIDASPTDENAGGVVSPYGPGTTYSGERAAENQSSERPYPDEQPGQEKRRFWFW